MDCKFVLKPSLIKQKETIRNIYCSSINAHGEIIFHRPTRKILIKDNTVKCKLKYILTDARIALYRVINLVLLIKRFFFFWLMRFIAIQAIN